MMLGWQRIQHGVLRAAAIDPLAAALKGLIRRDHYQPEKHYMRGKRRATHSCADRLDHRSEVES